jgi:hypothetical protein
MVVVAVIGAGLAGVRNLSPAMTSNARIAMLGSLPMACILAVYLVLTVFDLTDRGEVALSRVALLIVGGSAMLLPIYFSILAPWWFNDYLRFTAGFVQSLFLTQSDRTAIAQGLRPSIPYGLVGILLAWATITLTLLVPALLAAWATRGCRLRLVKAGHAAGDPGREPGNEPR